MFSHLASGSSFESIPVSKLLPDPKATNYKIIRYEEYFGDLLIEIKYLDCTNYEGRKILYYKDCTMDELEKQALIDPHFSENKEFKSPVARFEPTNKGLVMAYQVMMKRL